MVKGGQIGIQKAWYFTKLFSAKEAFPNNIRSNLAKAFIIIS
jgi:hypothetical protein